MAMMSRRQAVLSAMSIGAVTPLAGCLTCPADPADQGGIDWVPDVMHPVAAGFEDVDVAQGAPGPARIWYPTFEVFSEGGPQVPRKILKHCVARWPVVLFLHGMPPCQIPDYNREWTAIPANLARSGFVVVAPQHFSHLPQDSSDVPFVASFLDWVRTQWQHAEWTARPAPATAVVGHSYGALLSARVAAARPSISACVFLSGPWTELIDHMSLLGGLARPSFYMFAARRDPEDVIEHGLWDTFEYTRYAAGYGGQHFDYIDQPLGCGKPKGPCDLIKPVSADLVALFLSRYPGVGASRTYIPLDLVPPPAPLAPGKQQFFGLNRLPGLAQIDEREGCSVDLRWKQDADEGSRHLGP
jgi:pimeloyl-ACP methyl ester carboxylesterase